MKKNIRLVLLAFVFIFALIYMSSLNETSEVEEQKSAHAADKTNSDDTVVVTATKKEQTKVVIILIIVWIVLGICIYLGPPGVFAGG